MSVSWELNKQYAALALDDWRVELEPMKPANGLTVSQTGKTIGQLLCVLPQPTHSCTIQEAYVRQRDLIVRYEQLSDDLYTFQLNWRAFECELAGALGIELWISIQTTLLDTHPIVDVKSTAIGSNWETLSLRDLNAGLSELPAVMVARGAEHSLLVMVQESDSEQVEVQHCDSASDNTLRMFGQFMEKGVIRRARLCFVVSPQMLNNAEIIRSFEQFSLRPLPLTA